MNKLIKKTLRIIITATFPIWIIPVFIFEFYIFVWDKTGEWFEKIKEL